MEPQNRFKNSLNIYLNSKHIKDRLVLKINLFFTLKSVTNNLGRPEEVAYVAFHLL